jgi:hypothetical protein
VWTAACSPTTCCSSRRWRLLLALLRIVNSPFGRVLQAIRENEFRAEAIGYRVVVYRTTSSVLSALFATLAGAMLALWLRYNGPDTSLSFEIMIDVLLIVVIGGMGTHVWRGHRRGGVPGGAKLPAGLLKLGSEAAARRALLSALLSPDRWLLWLGLLFVLSVYYFPTGVVGRLRARAWGAGVRWFRWLSARRLPQDLVVGQVAPLSGVLASTGAQMVLGGRIYFDHINSKGGIHGARIRQVVADDGYKVDETVRLTQDLLARPDVVALYGFAGTANVGKLLSEGVLEQGGAALVAPYTGGEPLRSPFNPWIYHVRAGYADEAEHMVQQVTTLGMNRVAVMYQDDGFGKAGLVGVEAALAKRGLKLAVAAGYERNTDKVDDAVKKDQGVRCAGGHHDLHQQAHGRVHQALPRVGRRRAAVQHLGGGPGGAGQAGWPEERAWPGHQPGGAVPLHAQPAGDPRIPGAAGQTRARENWSTTPASSSSWAPRCWWRLCAVPDPSPRAPRWPVPWKALGALRPGRHHGELFARQPRGHRATWK